MTTTHIAPRKIFNLSPLPPELWYTILREATWVPYIMDADPRLQFSLSFPREERRLLWQSLVTKRYLVRVCKTWNNWANQFLYECIYLRRSRSLVALCSTLTKSDREHRASDREYSLGWWTKRLYMVMEESSTIELDSKLFSDIFKCLPNLTVAAIRTSTLMDLTVSNLGQWCGPNLRAFKWYGSQRPQADIWNSFLLQSKNLRELHFPPFTFTYEIPTLDLTFPHLESLCANSPREIPKAEFPSLRHLNICSCDTAVWLPFLERHGTKLEVIQLTLYEFSVSEADLTIITATCPHLIRLDLCLDGWGLFAQFPWVLVVPVSVQTLGLQNWFKESDAQDYTCLFSALEEMPCGPKLKYVQLIDQQDVTHLREKHPQVLRIGVEVLKKRGLVLRDHDGLLME